MQTIPQNSPTTPVQPLNTDEYLRQYYYAQWQQYYAMLWQQYYAQQQQIYGGDFRPAQIQQQPQPVYSHGGAFASLPVVPANLKKADKEVFISYSTRNPKEAAFVCRKLEEAGMRCWIAPRDLLPGTNFADNIEAALANARCMVLICSKDSVSSPWVEGEVNTAFSNGMPILVYQIEQVHLSGAMKVMIEKFRTIAASGDSEKDAGTLIYNAMILTGRTPAPEGYEPISPVPVRAAARPAQRRTTPAPAAGRQAGQTQAAASAPAGFGKGGIFAVVAAVAVLFLVFLLTARFWFPLLPKAISGS